MLVLFDYDSTTGTITDKIGTSVCMHGMVPFDDEKKESDTIIKNVIELKAAGFTADEIIKMKTVLK